MPSPEIPGTRAKPRRFVPRFHWELIACGVGGHELVGMEAEHIRPQDRVFAFEREGVRWVRCLRCDSWVPLEPPRRPTCDHPPDRDEIALPLRGKALRDKIVLRLIAINRAVHFLVLGLVGAAILVFAANRGDLRAGFYKVMADLNGSVSHQQQSGHGLLHEIDHLFSLQSSTLHLVGAVVLVYAVVELVEAVGLWLMKRWAEYLTFLVTTSLLPIEVYELTQRLSVLKVVTIVINVAVCVYLLFAKRLFGLRGGAAADEAERERDAGWPALERAAPSPR